jgi:hypothetical protein
VRHICSVRFFAYRTFSFRGDKGEIALVQQYASRGDLYDWLEAGMTDAEMRSVLADMV